MASDVASDSSVASEPFDYVIAEPLGKSQLDAYARRLGEKLVVVASAADITSRFREDFESDVKVVEEAYKLSIEWNKSQATTVPVAEWLLDNFYIIREQIRDVRKHLPRSFLKELPRIADGRVRVHEIARELTSHCDRALDEELIFRFVDEFQHSAELTIGETWAFPIMLRLVLIEHLRLLCSQLIQEYQSVGLVDDILSKWKQGNRLVLPEVSSLRGSPLLLALDTALRERGDEYEDARMAFDRLRKSLGWNLPELRRLEQHRMAAHQVSMGNIITSMRLLTSLDWVSFFENTNRVERILRQDSAEIYSEMDFPSRNRYRDAIEKLSKWSKYSETEVANLALQFAKHSFESTKSSTASTKVRQLSSHIGYWLIDEGRKQLEAAVDFKPRFFEKFVHSIQLRSRLAYFGFVCLSTLLVMSLFTVLCFAMGVHFGSVVWLGVLAVLPITELVLLITNTVVTRLLPVHLLPKLEFRDGIAEEYPTFVVVPSMLTSERDVQYLLAKMEDHFLANSESPLCFALLTDFADAPQQNMDGDARILHLAVEGVRRVNAKYSHTGRSPFFLFHRERQYNQSEGKWMGWERKRGKLMEFGELLLGDAQTSYIVREGDLSRLAKFKDARSSPFIITLDSDTVLPRGAARKLIGTLAHPLNRPATSNHDVSCITRGYAVLQPRVSIHLSETQKTRYSRVYAVNPGIDPYTSAASDVYQDLFAEGSFTGKGIYDLRAFHSVLNKIFPENRILSHDLIEGCHARVALVSDVEVFDGYPGRYDSDAKRMHRWVRGDWQIAPWLFPYVKTESGSQKNQLSMLSRWKIFDNLRRSLLAPLVLAFLVVGWLAVPHLSIVWTFLGALYYFFPVVLQAVTSGIDLMGSEEKREQLRVALKFIRKTAEQGLYNAVFLPHKSLQMLDAIVRTIYRMTVSGKRLLEWETAAAMENRLLQERWALEKQLAVCSVLAIVLLVIMLPRGQLGAVPFVALWLFAPLVGQLISKPTRRKEFQIDQTDVGWIHQIASGTWGFFEYFVNEDGNWLPPDNVQEYPKEKIAYRISPTNEGLFLVSGLVAHRLGFAGLTGLVDLWEKNLTSWNSLEMLHGHHFNWYETSTLAPLRPHYVSTVDSGNLAACYLTLAKGIEDVGKRPLFSEALFLGARSSLQWLRSAIIATRSRLDPRTSSYANSILQLKNLDSLTANIEASFAYPNFAFETLERFADDLEKASSQLESWSDTAMQKIVKEEGKEEVEPIIVQSVLIADRFKKIRRDIDELAPWLTYARKIYDQSKKSENEAINKFLEVCNLNIDLRSLAILPQFIHSNEELKDALSATEDFSWPDFLHRLNKGAEAAEQLWRRLTRIGVQCEAAVQKMDFQFLYNSRRKLFSIGFNVDAGKLDRGHYDLLCSECRIASYIALAKGDVETEHWFRLGRQATDIDGGYSLMSWGGTMFEFLMPQLFHRAYEGSILYASCQTSIARQIEYGKQRNVPWGISESAYSAIASNSDYQYRSFGVPGLGLKRGLSRDLVISPYSTMLALPFAPRESTANLKKLADFALGNWGFFDAVDYTPSRLRAKQTVNVVRNYMAHHQGMTLLSVANTIHDGIVQKWFHQHSLVRANELLLQEKLPSVFVTDVPRMDESEESVSQRSDSMLVSRQISNVHSSSPRTHVLSNGQFSSMLTHTGGGYIKHKDQQVTRWRPDATKDNWGSFIYLRDLESGEFWSPTYQPTRIEPDHYEAIFSVDKYEVRRRQGDIETILEVVVSPEHNAEVRQLRITNHSHMPKRIEVTSYAEVALASQAADIAHPAFQKLFVETEYIAEEATLIARRRPRASNQAPIYAVHTMARQGNVDLGPVDYDSSRETFLGRGCSIECPRAMKEKVLSKTVGAVLDPVFALRSAIEIGPSESITIGLTTAIATSREQALVLGDLFHDLRAVQRAFELAWAFTQVELRHLNLTAKQVHLYQQLGGLLLYPDPCLRGDPARIVANRIGQSALWRFGISGDVPILLVRISDTDELSLVRDVAAAHQFLKSRGLLFDLVISNDYPGTYLDALQEQIQTIINERQVGDAVPDRVFVLRGAQLSVEDHQLLDTVASVLLRGSRGAMAQQIETAMMKHRSLSVASRSREMGVTKSQTDDTTELVLVSDASNEENRQIVGAPMDQEFSNGYGKFTDQGSRYEMKVEKHKATPAPWSNVIANPSFGCLVTESGGGYSWFGNSRENKITSWSNDPVLDSPSEIIYLKDAASQQAWSPTTTLEGAPDRRVIHGQGYSSFMARHDGLECETVITVDCDEPVKYVRLRIHNRNNEKRSLEATYYAETVLGVSREASVLHQASSYDDEQKSLLMTNGYHPDFNSQIVFLKVLGSDQVSWTADRRSFIGRDGSIESPVGIENDLNCRVGAGFDPCMVIRGKIDVLSNETVELIFVLGAGRDREHLESVFEKITSVEIVSASIRKSVENWRSILSTLTVQTPNPSFDILVNHWLLYQVLSCRVWGRTAFYQSGGAYGFRDQLQDVMAMLYSRPDIAREHILRAASRQYVEGDVQHWWHPPSGKGTRTRFSDDFLFLPYVTLRYIQVTGDRSILNEQVTSIDSVRLLPDEDERYEQPMFVNQTKSLLEHCIAAVSHGEKYGVHDLPLMGCGDWNDGMNNVGHQGRGESVWVAWFQIVIYEQFGLLLSELNDAHRADHYAQQAIKLRKAIDEHAWDGEWYRRAFFDDGTPLGSATNDECQIDSLAQAWAIIAKGNDERSRQAFQSACDRLVDQESGMILLFDPPFDKTELDPGYIKGYVPGVRENGGQYSHAAMWMIQAAAESMDGDLAVKLFDTINPILHSNTQSKADLYKVEPYVIAADVYSNQQHKGRGGWTWYTGSASWMYRVAIESILGIGIEKDRMTIKPVVPSDWNEFRFSYRRGTTKWRVRVVKKGHGDTWDVVPASIDLVEDGQEHELTIEF